MLQPRTQGQALLDAEPVSRLNVVVAGHAPGVIVLCGDSPAPAPPLAKMLQRNIGDWFQPFSSKVAEDAAMANESERYTAEAQARQEREPAKLREALLIVLKCLSAAAA